MESNNIVWRENGFFSEEHLVKLRKLLHVDPETITVDEDLDEDVLLSEMNVNFDSTKFVYLAQVMACPMDIAYKIAANVVLNPNRIVSVFKYYKNTKEVANISIWAFPDSKIIHTFKVEQIRGFSLVFNQEKTDISYINKSTFPVFSRSVTKIPLDRIPCLSMEDFKSQEEQKKQVKQEQKQEKQEVVKQEQKQKQEKIFYVIKDEDLAEYVWV
jgi:hypothetical protein